MGAPYLDFDRPAWAALRAATPLTLSEADLVELRGLNERVSLAEVEAIYLPLSRLLNLHVAATQTLHAASDTFLGQPSHTPYVIGVGGSVAVGKSTFSRILRTLLSRWPAHPRVDIVTTDGFLFPNRVLEAKGALARKGFPDSYDVRALIQFMSDVKVGQGAVHAPVYSHQSYDILAGEFQVVDAPDIVIVEGLNVLQTGSGRAGRPMPLFVSDFFDFSIYVDAYEGDIGAMHGGANLLLSEFGGLRERRNMHAPFIFAVVERAGAVDDDLALAHRQRSLVEQAAATKFLPGPRLRSHDAEQQQRRCAAHNAVKLLLDVRCIGRRQRCEA